MTGSMLRSGAVLGWTLLSLAVWDATAFAQDKRATDAHAAVPVKHAANAAKADGTTPGANTAATPEKAPASDAKPEAATATPAEPAAGKAAAGQTGTAATAPAVASPPPAAAPDPTAGDRTALIDQDVAQHPPQTTIPSRDPSRLMTTKMKLGGLLDRSVHSLENSEVGRVIDVMTGDDGKPAALELDVGGFMGVGNRRIAVAWKLFDLTRTGQNDPLRVALSAAQLRSAPAVDESGETQVVIGAEPVGAAPPDGKPGAAQSKGAPTPAPAATSPAAAPPASPSAPAATVPPAGQQTAPAETATSRTDTFKADTSKTGVAKPTEPAAEASHQTKDVPALKPATTETGHHSEADAHAAKPDRKAIHPAETAATRHEDAAHHDPEVAPEDRNGEPRF